MTQIKCDGCGARFWSASDPLVEGGSVKQYCRRCQQKLALPAAVAPEKAGKAAPRPRVEGSGLFDVRALAALTIASVRQPPRDEVIETFSVGHPLAAAPELRVVQALPVHAGQTPPASVEPAPPLSAGRTPPPPVAPAHPRVGLTRAVPTWTAGLVALASAFAGAALVLVNRAPPAPVEPPAAVAMAPVRPAEAPVRIEAPPPPPAHVMASIAMAPSARPAEAPVRVDAPRPPEARAAAGPPAVRAAVTQATTISHSPTAAAAPAAMPPPTLAPPPPGESERHPDLPRLPAATRPLPHVRFDVAAGPAAAPVTAAGVPAPAAPAEAPAPAPGATTPAASVAAPAATPRDEDEDEDAIAIAPAPAARAAEKKGDDKIATLIERSTPTPRNTPPPPDESTDSRVLPEQLDSAEVTAVMHSVRPAVAACFERYHVPGMAVVNTVIAGTGHVASATVKGALAGTPTGDCVSSAVRAAGFKRFSGRPITIHYSYLLR